MKKFVSRLGAVLLVLVMTVSLFSCGKSDAEIENLFAEFEYACNTLDFDAALNCITPRVSDKINMAANLVGMFTSQDKEDLFERLATVLTGDSAINGLDFFESIHIEMVEIVPDEEYKDILYVMTYITYDFAGDEMTKEAVFTCENYVEKWYISGFSFV